MSLPTIWQVVAEGDGRTIAEVLYRPGMLFRMKGLLGRKTLEKGAGIWLKPCNSIHMFFMKFPIDAIFLDSSGRIVRIYHQIRPWRITPVILSSRSVLEIRAGEAALHQLTEGCQLRITLKKA